MPGWTNLSVATGFNLAVNNTRPGYENTTSFNLAEDLSIEMGRHQLGLGGTWIHQNLNGITYFSAPPTVTFDGHFTSTGLGDFMLGKAATFARATR